MKTCSILLLLVAVIFASSCRDDDPTGPDQPTTGSLKVEVLRDEEIEPLATVVAFTADTRDDGVLYFGTTAMDGSCTLTGLPAGIYSVNASKSIAESLHSAQSQNAVGDCWTIRDWGQGCLESESETVQTPLGEFTDCWTVKLRSNGGNEFYFSLKEGIGPVKFVFAGETHLLASYELQ